MVEIKHENQQFLEMNSITERISKINYYSEIQMIQITNETHEHFCTAILRQFTKVHIQPTLNSLTTTRLRIIFSKVRCDSQ